MAAVYYSHTYPYTSPASYAKEEAAAVTLDPFACYEMALHYLEQPHDGAAGVFADAEAKGLAWLDEAVRHSRSDSESDIEIRAMLADTYEELAHSRAMRHTATTVAAVKLLAKAQDLRHVEPTHWSVKLKLLIRNCNCATCLQHRRQKGLMATTTTLALPSIKINDAARVAVSGTKAISYGGMYGEFVAEYNRLMYYIHLLALGEREVERGSIEALCWMGEFYKSESPLQDIEQAKNFFWLADQHGNFRARKLLMSMEIIAPVIKVAPLAPTFADKVRAHLNPHPPAPRLEQPVTPVTHNWKVTKLHTSRKFKMKQSLRLHQRSEAASSLLPVHMEDGVEPIFILPVELIEGL
jgi:hypothetical protein